jgi:hypothetical protein
MKLYNWTYTYEEELWQQSWCDKLYSLILNEDIFVGLQ